MGIFKLARELHETLYLLMRETMNAVRYYPGQFAVTPDLLHVTVPQSEILQEMFERGEQATLNDICLAVAVIADAIDAAQTQEV